MTDSFVTQCPHCQTSFRVSHAQLSVARGVVRCGACLQVFNAARQLLPAFTPQPSQAKAVEDDDDIWQVSEMDLDNLNLDEELARLEQRETRRPFEQTASPADNDTVSLTAKRDTRQTDLPELHAEVVSDADSTEEPEPVSDNNRTEPSLSLDKDLDDDEPNMPVITQRRALPVEKAERWSAVDDDDQDDEQSPSLIRAANAHATSRQCAIRLCWT